MMRRFRWPDIDPLYLLESGELCAATRSEQLGMSARSFHRVLKLARTIADLEGTETIQRYISRRRCNTVRGGRHSRIERGYVTFLAKRM
jgi:hypothetical protein